MNPFFTDYDAPYQIPPFDEIKEEHYMPAFDKGMKEQLEAALRFSMADVLKEEHDGCLPLVFDDAFTNSDPSRIPMIKEMIFKAAERGLQIIFLTCNPAAYGSFADKEFIFTKK